MEYLRTLDGVGGPEVPASEVASFMWSIDREWRYTRGGGNCLFWAFLSALSACGLPSSLPGPASKATMMCLREAIAKHVGNVSVQAVMARGRGWWQRSNNTAEEYVFADKRPGQAAEYPSFIKKDGEWGNQFDVALLAKELDLLQTGVTTPHRRLVSVDPRPVPLNTEEGGDHRIQVHLPPDINGKDRHAVAPYQIIKLEGVQPGDVVIGLAADWYWWCTAPVELAASQMHHTAQNGGLAAAMQADHALLVPEPTLAAPDAGAPPTNPHASTRECGGDNNSGSKGLVDVSGSGSGNGTSDGDSTGMQDDGLMDGQVLLCIGSRKALEKITFI